MGGKGSGKGRKYDLDDNYFTNPTRQSAYWAGFLAADGNISKRQNLVTVALSVKDLEHLMIFSDQIKFEGSIKIKDTSNGYKCAWMEFTSRQVITDLCNIYNIVPMKSNILIPPNIIEQNLINAFIVGYIDGDGGIYYCNRVDKGKNDLQLQCVGTYDMCLWIKNNLDLLYGSSMGGVHSYRNQFRYSVTSHFVYKMCKILPQNDIPFLHRKWIEPFEKMKSEKTAILSRGEYESGDANAKRIFEADK